MFYTTYKEEFMETFFMEKSFVIAAILKTKNNHFLSEFVTVKEVDYIAKVLQNIFVHRGIDVCVIDEINSKHFTLYGDIYILNEGITLSILEEFYKCSCPTVEILRTLWDDDLIYNSLKKQSKPKSKIKRMHR